MPTTTIYTHDDLTYRSGASSITAPAAYCPTCSYHGVGYLLADPSQPLGSKNTVGNVSHSALLRWVRPSAASFPTGWYLTSAGVWIYQTQASHGLGEPINALRGGTSASETNLSPSAPTGTLKGTFVTDNGSAVYLGALWIGASLPFDLITSWIKQIDGSDVNDKNMTSIIVSPGAGWDSSEDYFVGYARESGSPAYLQFTWTVPIPTAPGAWSLPSGNVAVPQGQSVALDFADAGVNGGPAITGYTIERRYNGGAWATHSTPASSSGTFDTTGMAAGVYEFRAKASNGYEESSYGVTSPSVTVLVGPPRTMPGS